MKDYNKKFFRKNGSKLLLDTVKCEIYVPEAYFDSKLVLQDGEIYDLFFVLKYRLFHTNSDDRSRLPVHDFFLPTMVLTKPDEVSEKIEMDLYGVKEKFVIFTYYKNGEIMHNRDIVKTPNMVERYVTLLNDGKIRAPYHVVNSLTNKVQKIHNVKLNVPQYIQQITISEVYRDKNDLSVPARFIMSDKDKDNKKIRGLNMRENSAFTSTLAGVAFEDVRSMLTVADNRDDDENEPLSSIEKAIKGIR